MSLLQMIVEFNNSHFISKVVFSKNSYFLTSHCPLTDVSSIKSTLFVEE